VKLVNKALGMLVGIVGGMVAKALFKKIWKVTTGEDEAPKPTDARRTWLEILLAAALQGAIFAVVKAALARATAQGTGSLTDDGPADAAGEEAGAPVAKRA